MLLAHYLKSLECVAAFANELQAGYFADISLEYILRYRLVVYNKYFYLVHLMQGLSEPVPYKICHPVLYQCYVCRGTAKLTFCASFQVRYLGCLSCLLLVYGCSLTEW